MEVKSQQYPELARKILRQTPQVREAVTRAALHFDHNRQTAYAEIDAAFWRQWAEAVKNHVLTHLDHYLELAEQRLAARGVRVHWAETAEDARRVLRELVRAHGVKRAVKAKSMLSEELGVNPALEALGVEVFETDLGEYIIQLAGEPPSHIVGPAIHRNLEEIRRLFHERLGTPLDAEPDALAREARRVLREAFLSAEMGVSGANFLVAETGTIALIENEGNIRLTTSLPKVHVALVGIEKLLPSLADLAVFLQLTARAATGQRIGTFVSLIQGPRTEAEPDGPEEVHVVLVDNGRSALLADPEAWEVLRCVRCGACLNACPVYRQTGGHAYGWVYSGPIGAVLDPGLLGLEATLPLPFASSLCGACFEVCPVRIPIPKLLVTWRQRAVAAGLASRPEAGAVRAYAEVMTRPELYRLFSKALRVFPGALEHPVLPVVRAWRAGRSGLKPSPKSFRELWEEGAV
ncbi:LutB/LldF family L-lactate oxidation iron-sulfur protein [Marinithermus hydrothermalis]|uniref:Iron-sulfur cluster binding protein n=1 Tax=Marinithermus hydrothermalis (strain DSM 14884 / JCM 11576 / T1) TaxID=869210 RepID=F2NKK0_MARHT|nr:LutB/LldF family L-lactate oxidation iron-sulfur protein [Marinithermus hydrothermalis]AEB12660.1 iron-sulfur cluster binding protein [Marinithermus hydrothermalis DSM 14884]